MRDRHNALVRNVGITCCLIMQAFGLLLASVGVGFGAVLSFLFFLAMLFVMMEAR